MGRRECNILLKKAQGFEAWFFVIAFILAAAIVFLVLNKAWSSIEPELNTGLQSSLEGHDTTNVNVSETLSDVTSTAQSFDRLLPLLIIGLFAFVLIMAGAIMRHPIMIFVGIIVLAVVFTLAVIFANVYSNISDSSSFSETKADLPIQDKFMKYLPVWITLMAIGVAIGIIWYRSSGGGTL